MVTVRRGQGEDLKNSTLGDMVMVEDAEASGFGIKCMKCQVENWIK